MVDLHKQSPSSFDAYDYLKKSLESIPHHIILTAIHEMKYDKVYAAQIRVLFARYNTFQSVRFLSDKERVEASMHMINGQPIINKDVYYDCEIYVTFLNSLLNPSRPVWFDDIWALLFNYTPFMVENSINLCTLRLMKEGAHHVTCWKTFKPSTLCIFICQQSNSHWKAALLEGQWMNNWQKAQEILRYDALVAARSVTFTTPAGHVVTLSPSSPLPPSSKVSTSSNASITNSTLDAASNHTNASCSTQMAKGVNGRASTDQCA